MEGEERGGEGRGDERRAPALRWYRVPEWLIRALIQYYHLIR